MEHSAYTLSYVTSTYDSTLWSQKLTSTIAPTILRRDLEEVQCVKTSQVAPRSPCCLERFVFSGSFLQVYKRTIRLAGVRHAGINFNASTVTTPPSSRKNMCGSDDMQGKEPEEITIAVMGPTGTGKSSFINLLSGASLKVGGNLESCTTSVQAAEPFELDGHRVTLIDTPGFDDSTLRDTDVLAMIAAHLSHTYKHGKLLAGVIYMHRILDNRMGGISSRNFKMFRNLCGDASLKNVAIVTNMWGMIEVHLGEARESELASKDIFFKSAVDNGARLLRHDGTVESARAIVRSFFGHEPQALQIQRELEAGMDISQTSAGKELNRDLMDRIAQHRKEMQALMEEMNEASRRRDEETRKELAEDRAKLQEEVKRIQDDARNMAAGYAEALAKLEQRMKDTESAAKVSKEVNDAKELQVRNDDHFKHFKSAVPDNAVLEAKLGGAFPIFGFWGKLAVMLSPFSLSWK
ncbi:putative 50S ribosome-binding GTPase [Lyophyllum shimeji]|uniref:50S ribosome-binding GTPase n=1 Tax=Lyophyllum shimeji TaxID=47721 RepID=A0A9P3UVQ6_LYOSH|nr:putative 50S ribosome-binding GTPase [Lyophyllum shimeji]